MEKISVSGTAVNFAPVEQNAIITVHNIVNERDLFVKVESPTGSTIPATLKQELHSTNVTIEFFPREPGEHQIHLKYRGTPLPGSPFSCKVYDIRQIGVKEMPSEIIAGKPVTFLGQSLVCLFLLSLSSVFFSSLSSVFFSSLSSVFFSFPVSMRSFHSFLSFFSFSPFSSLQPQFSQT